MFDFLLFQWIFTHERLWTFYFYNYIMFVRIKKYQSKIYWSYSHWSIILSCPTLYRKTQSSLVPCKIVFFATADLIGKILNLISCTRIPVEEDQLVRSNSRTWLRNTQHLLIGRDLAVQPGQFSLDRWLITRLQSGRGETKTAEQKLL